MMAEITSKISDFYLVLTLLDLKIGSSRESESNFSLPLMTSFNYLSVSISCSVSTDEILLDEIYIDEPLVVSPTTPS